MRVLILKVFNAPAFTTSKKLSFYIRKENADSLIYQPPDYKDDLYYPFDNAQYTITTVDDKVTHKFAQSIFPNLLIRKVRVEYQWISDSTLKYFFEGEWKYNLEKQDWDIILQKAD